MTVVLSTVTSLCWTASSKAQFTPIQPQAIPANSVTASVTSATPRQIVIAAETALAKQDYTTAVKQYRSAIAAGATKDATLATRLAGLKTQLTQKGIDAELLEMPNAVASTSTRRAEALRLTAIGRAALDRGDAVTAFRHANQASTLGVPDHEFAPGDPRPWQLLLDAKSVAKRQGIAPEQLSGTTAPAAGVTPAAGTWAGTLNPHAIAQNSAAQNSIAQGPSAQGPIAQAGGFQAMPLTQSGSPIQQVQAALPTEPLDLKADTGTKLFQEGMKLLTQGQKTQARAKFVEAWKYESTLDTETRRSLQDKLTLLQPSRLPSTNSNESEPMTPMQKAELEAQSQTRRLYREVTSELAKANEKRESAPLDAVDDLQRVLRRIDGANVDAASKASLAAMVNRALAEQRSYVEANRADIELKLQNEAVRTELATEATREARIDEEISSLVETFNDLMDQERYAEAEIIAKEVRELKPNSTIATSMFHSSRMKTRIQIDQEITAASEDGFARTMLDLGRTAIPMDPQREIEYPEPRSWEEMSRLRIAADDTDSMLSPKEQQIERTLQSQEVKLNYRNRPLGEVLDDLSALSGIPMVMDMRALGAVRVSSDTPVMMSISQPISLRSALNLMLKDLDLTYVIENDVLNVTSREARRLKVIARTYRVADLVTPIPNFVAGYEQGLAGALKAAYQMVQPTANVQVMPVSATDLGAGLANNRNASMNPNILGQYSPGVSGGGFAGGGLGAGGAVRGGAGGGAIADFDSLMNLIQQTIEPTTWEALGGVGTMAPYPQNLSLVISTTSDVHDQIVDLLETLRRLQNLQITIEVRFITLADTFFEQIGIDFDVQFDDNATGLPADDSGNDVTIGLSAPGIPTPDLDIRFENNSAGVVSPFGAPDAGAISSIGFAILSDIEAFFFLQAAQGDNRSNIMQAPKVTMFDGQIASINDNTQRPFVTSVIPVVGDFAVAQQPVIVVLDEGTKLNVQAVVSDDKRFVRVTLVPTFSQIGEVNTFTFQGTSTSRSSSQGRDTDTNGDGVIDDNDAVDDEESEETTTGTTVQQPVFAFTTVSTTVSVPDGGTILLGGIKRMSEGRTERGVPFLSKIPYVSRLFRNTAVGRDARSLMLMVTPRIIIQEEEEIAQTGFDPGR